MTYPFRQSWYHDLGPRKGSLGLDFHMAEGGDGTLDYLGDGGNPPARGVSANYCCLTDGTIYRMLGWDECAGTLNPADRAAETGYYGPSYLKAVLGDHWADPNTWSVSVEICGFRAQGPNAAQVEALVLWAADMKSRFPTLRGAFGHHDQSPKGCPGTTANMKAIFARVGGHGLWSTPVDQFNLTPDSSLSVPAGTVLYDNPGLNVSPGNTTITGAPLPRVLTLVGLFADQTRLVGYKPAGASVEHSYWVAKTVGQVVPAPPPVTDCQAAVAEAIARTKASAKVVFG